MIAHDNRQGEAHPACEVAEAMHHALGGAAAFWGCLVIVQGRQRFQDGFGWRWRQIKVVDMRSLASKKWEVSCGS